MQQPSSWIDAKYVFASGLVVLALGVTVIATERGWGLKNEAAALMRARNNSSGSVRSGSVHGRRFYGGGSGFGK